MHSQPITLPITILKIAQASEFAKPELNKFSDTLDSIIVVAKKKHGAE